MLHSLTQFLSSPFLCLSRSPWAALSLVSAEDVVFAWCRVGMELKEKKRPCFVVLFGDVVPYAECVVRV